MSEEYRKAKELEYLDSVNVSYLPRGIREGLEEDIKKAANLEADNALSGGSGSIKAREIMAEARGFIIGYLIRDLGEAPWK